jgi:hypothetical protein
MAKPRTRSSRVTEQLTDLSGRSDAEMTVIVGATLTLAGVALALRAYQILDDLGLLHGSHRDPRR